MRAFLDRDPVANAFIVDRAFQMAPDPRIYVDGVPPTAVLAVARPAWAHGDHGVGLHALTAAAAAAVVEGLPSGPAFCHLTDELALPAIRTRADSIDAWPAWLFRLDASGFVDGQRHEVRPLLQEWATMVAETWSPDWPAKDLIRARIQAGPSFAVFEKGEPVAWALTHFETPQVAVMGFLYVREEYRGNGYGRSVASALAKDLLRRGRIPILHVDVDNGPSLRLVESLGFRKVKRQVWAEAVFP